MSEHEVQRLKEEESRKIAAFGDPQKFEDDDLKNDDLNEMGRSYENMNFGAGGPHIRTKKAENRFGGGGGGGSTAIDSDLSPAAQRAIEAEKRAKWRQDR